MQDGRLLLDKLEKVVLSREKLFSALRAAGIQHLGQVKRLDLEGSGEFSVIKAPDAKPGLSIIPGRDPELRGASAVAGHFACASCGSQMEASQLPNQRCRYCGCSEWTEAVNPLAD